MSVAHCMNDHLHIHSGMGKLDCVKDQPNSIRHFPVSSSRVKLVFPGLIHTGSEAIISGILLCCYDNNHVLAGREGNP